jgi:hypothetical protein
LCKAREPTEEWGHTTPWPEGGKRICNKEREGVKKIVLMRAPWEPAGSHQLYRNENMCKKKDKEGKYTGKKME